MNYNNLFNGTDAIGNGEVDSSILSGSTSFTNTINFCLGALDAS